MTRTNSAIYQKRLKFRAILVTLLYFIIVLMPKASWAGGIYIVKEELQFNKSYEEREFESNDPIDMEFAYESFAYAGKPFAYIVFEVYKAGKDNKDEKVGLFVSSYQRGKAWGKARFHLPHPDSKYKITYHVVPFFSNTKLSTSIYGGYLNDADIAKINAFYTQNQKHTAPLVQLKSKSESAKLTKEDIVIYFENPTQVKTALEAGQPPRFKWFKGSESSKTASNVSYSYRLYPIEDWTVFSDSQEATYQFLRQGDYTFQVKAKFTGDNVEKESTVAEWKFTVRNTIFGLSKKETTEFHDQKPPQEFYQIKHYNKSRALLVGVKEYSDILHFSNLPFVDKDISKFSDALRKSGFEITTLVNNTDRATIERKMEEFLLTVQTGDRVIFYFSGHGTATGEYGYLASSDCKTNDKEQTCIGFQYLSAWVEKVMTERKAKHLLVVLDSCPAWASSASLPGNLQ
jgi:hypothetical protein